MFHFKSTSPCAALQVLRAPKAARVAWVASPVLFTLDPEPS